MSQQLCVVNDILRLLIGYVSNVGSCVPVPTTNKITSSYKYINNATSSTSHLLGSIRKTAREIRISWHSDVKPLDLE